MERRSLFCEWGHGIEAMTFLQKKTKIMVSDKLAPCCTGLHKIEIGLGTKFQYQFSAWFSRNSYSVW